MMVNRREPRAHFAVITEHERIADALTRDVRRLSVLPAPEQMVGLPIAVAMPTWDQDSNLRMDVWPINGPWPPVDVAAQGRGLLLRSPQAEAGPLRGAAARG